MTIPKALLERRKVPPVVLRLRRQYTRRRWNGEAHEAILKIGCQYFTFATAETKAEAMRDKYGDDFYLAPRPRKHRYIYLHGSKTFKKDVLKKLKYGIEDYPKT